MSTDIKLSKAQISKIIQSVGFFAYWLGNLGKKTLANVAIPLARDSLPVLVSNLASIAINKFEKNKFKRSSQNKIRIYFIYFKCRDE